VTKARETTNKISGRSIEKRILKSFESLSSNSPPTRKVLEPIEEENVPIMAQQIDPEASFSPLFLIDDLSDQILLNDNAFHIPGAAKLKPKP
jgi:hypothetical protein